MCRLTDCLDLYEVDPAAKTVRRVDGGFDSLRDIVRHLRKRGDRECCYSVGDFGGSIRAVALFRGDEILLLTGDREVLS